MKLRFLSIEHLKNETFRAFHRFPLTSGFAVFTTVLLIWIIGSETKLTEESILTNLVGVGFLGIPLSLTFHLISENLPQFLKIPARWVPLLTFVPLSGFLLWLQTHQNNGEAIRFLQWAFYCHLAVAIAPFLKQPASSQGFWNFNYRIFINFLISRFFGAFLWGGLSLAMIAITALFEVKISDKTYAISSVICLILISTFHFLALLPESMSEDPERPKILKIFCQFVLVPLNVIYILILYAYLFKILATGQWPQGMISWLVSGVAILGVFALLMMHTFSQQEENHWMKRFQTGYYMSVIPLLLMGLVAVGIRIQQYQITERRYVLIALSLWLIGIATYNLVSKAKNIIVIPASLFVVAFLTSFGPWGLYQVSWQSQASRLESLLEKYKALQNGLLSKGSETFSKADALEVKEITTYFIKFHGAQALPDFFPEADKEKFEQWGSQKHSYALNGRIEDLLRERLNFPASLENPGDERPSYDFYSSKHGSLIAPDLLFLSFDASGSYFKAANGKTYSFSIDQSEIALYLRENETEILKGDLRPWLEKLRNSDSSSKNLVWTFKNEKIELFVMPNQISGKKINEEIKNLHISGDAIIRFLDQ